MNTMLKLSMIKLLLLIFNIMSISLALRDVLVIHSLMFIVGVNDYHNKKKIIKCSWSTLQSSKDLDINNLRVTLTLDKTIIQ